MRILLAGVVLGGVVLLIVFASAKAPPLATVAPVREPAPPVTPQPIPPPRRPPPPAPLSQPPPAALAALLPRPRPRPLPAVLKALPVERLTHPQLVAEEKAGFTPAKIFPGGRARPAQQNADALAARDERLLREAEVRRRITATVPPAQRARVLRTFNRSRPPIIGTLA